MAVAVTLQNEDKHLQEMNDPPTVAIHQAGFIGIVSSSAVDSCPNSHLAHRYR